MTGSVTLGATTAGFVQEGSKALMRGEGVQVAGEKALVGAGVGAIAGKFGSKLAASGAGPIGQALRSTGIGKSVSGNEAMANMMSGKMRSGQASNISEGTLVKIIGATATSGAASAEIGGRTTGTINDRFNKSCGVGEHC